MQCPGCGRYVPEDNRFCPTCGHALGPMVVQIPPSSPEAKKGLSSAMIALIVTVVAVVVVMGVVALILLASSMHDLRTDLSYSAENSWLGLGSSGNVEVWGYVYNYGSSDCLGTLHLRIFDGYSWHEYTELLGLIPGNGGYVFFDEVYGFASLNTDAVQVEYSLTGE